jgi:hypothetical protein
VTGSPDPAESPEADEVRRLLADARHTEPMPDDVVARMDDVLAGLRDDPAESPARHAATAAARDDNVVPMAVHRRRAAGLLVAAAAIVVGGVVVAQNLPQSTSSSSSASEGAVGNSGADAQKSPGPNQPPTVSGGDLRADAGRLVVHPQRFSVDALTGLRLLRHTPARAASAPSSVGACVSLPARAGKVLPVTYQHAPAALVYHSASGGSQVVDLYVCGSRRPVRSATLPAR